MKAVVDRIEDSIAVLVLCENSATIIRLPYFLLPYAREGDLVDLLVTKDEAGTAAAREKSRRMVDKLGKNFLDESCMHDSSINAPLNKNI